MSEPAIDETYPQPRDKRLTDDEVVRLVRIGEEADPVDLQPCGGTHVRRTAEIGRVEVTKLENKGKQNRRVYLVLGE